MAESTKRKICEALEPLTPLQRENVLRAVMAELVTGRAFIDVREAGRRRWKGLTKSDRVKITSANGKAAWASMTAKERSDEMKRRCQVRERNRKARQTGPGTDSGRRA